MEEVTKCRYIDCVDIREKEQILHELPVCDTGLCVMWLINSGHVDLIGSDLDALRSMKFFICNNHFTEDCYLSKGTLKENAVPSPHWSAVSRTLRNLKIRRVGILLRSTFLSLNLFLNLFLKAFVKLNAQLPRLLPRLSPLRLFLLLLLLLLLFLLSPLLTALLITLLTIVNDRHV